MEHKHGGGGLFSILLLSVETPSRLLSKISINILCGENLRVNDWKY